MLQIIYVKEVFIYISFNFQGGDGDDEQAATNGTMQILSSAMALLRKCRVNAALTIQLFSQLFHFINMWTFNQIVTCHYRPEGKPVNYCTHRWAKKGCKLELWLQKNEFSRNSGANLGGKIQTSALERFRDQYFIDLSNFCPQNVQKKVCLLLLGQGAWSIELLSDDISTVHNFFAISLHNCL